MTGGAEHRGDGIAVEATLAGLASQFLGGRLRAQRSAVGSLLDHPLIGLDRCENPALRSERGATRAAVVARPIVSLVVLADDDAKASQGRRSRQHPLAVVRMEAHLLPFAFGKPAGLDPDAG